MSLLDNFTTIWHDFQFLRIYSDLAARMTLCTKKAETDSGTDKLCELEQILTSQALLSSVFKVTTRSAFIEVSRRSPKCLLN